MLEKVFGRLVNELGQTYNLTDKPINLGRAPDNEIVLESERCSRYHAQICPQNDAYYINDKNSKNGTWLNGERIYNAQILNEGDLIEVGGLQLKFEVLAPTLTAGLNTSQKLELNINYDLMQVGLNGKTYPLNGNSWRLLLFLYQNRNKNCSIDQIIHEVFKDKEVLNYAIQSAVSRLRKELEITDAIQPPRIVSIRGWGYRLEV